MIGRIAVTFGWGVSGFYPGPAITSLPLLAKGTFIFVPAMLIGIGVARLFTHAGSPSGKAVAASADEPSKPLKGWRFSLPRRALRSGCSSSYQVCARNQSSTSRSVNARKGAAIERSNCAFS